MYPVLGKQKERRILFYMGVFENLKEKAAKATQQFFEGEKEMEKVLEPVEETTSSMQLPENIVDEDIQQTAKEILQEAVAELNQVEDTIYVVKDCIETMEQEPDSTIITKMVINVAKKNPNVLKQDGENRLKKLETVVNDVKSTSKKALEEASNLEIQIREAETIAESSYTSDVSTLNQKCEERIKELRLKLKEDIEARGEQRDKELSSLKQQKEESKAERRKIEALTQAVIENAAKQQAEIELYLSKLQVEV